MAQMTSDYFMPAEAYWGKSPGAYEKALQAQASQTAQYMAMMDQYYAGIESQEKMFQQQLDQQESQYARSLGWEKERFGEELEWQKELSQSQLSLKEYEIRSQAGTAARGQDVQLAGARMQNALGMGQLDLARQQQDWKEGFMGQQLDMFSGALASQQAAAAKKEAAKKEAEKSKSVTYSPTNVVMKGGWLAEMNAAGAGGSVGNYGPAYGGSSDLLTDSWG